MYAFKTDHNLTLFLDEIAAAFDNETVLTRLILKAFIETLAMKSQPPTSLAQNALLQNQQAISTEVKSQ